MSSTQSISFSGLASGIDSTSIISAYTTAAQKPITLEQQKEDGYNSSLAAWQSLNSSLLSLQSAASSLTLPGTFTATTGTASNPTVASISTQPGAALGDHTLSVTQLAQAQKVVTGKVTSGSIALGQSGSFTLNGKTVTVGTSDSLTDMAAKINGAKAGVQATVVNVGANDFRMVLTGTQTGAAGAIAAADNGTGTVLSSLGLFSGTTAVRQTVTATNAGGSPLTGAGSLVLSSATQAVGTLLGAASGSAAAGTIAINGSATGISIDLNTDSLNDIANKINAAGVSGVTAQVVALPGATGQTGKQQLQIVSTSGSTPPTFTDSNNVLATLGVVQNQFGSTNQIASAQDAKFNMDGLDLTRSSNLVSDIVPGATIKLLSAGTSSAPATSTLSVAQDTNTIVQSVQSFASAYNAIQDYVRQQNAFTPPTDDTSGTAADSPPLFGDTTLSQIQDTLSQTLNAVSGSQTLQDIGITLDSNGDLQVDQGTLSGALQADPQSVANLFSLSGQSDTSQVQFVSGSSKTQATTGTGYTVNVTTPATQATLTAGGAASPSGAAETLTFGGTLFPSGVKITLAAGNTLQDTINQINSNSSLNGTLYAGQDGSGHLTLSSQQYGSGTGFTVASDTGAGSGLGTGAATAAAGTDVAGTINGEPATGVGRTLTGNAGNATTEALKLLVTATTAGPIGHVTVTHGVADALGTALTQILDPTNGVVIGAENSLNSQITDAQQQIQTMQDSVSAYSDYLKQMFSDMETRVSALQQQGAAFAAQIGATSSTSSSSTKKSS